MDARPVADVINFVTAVHPNLSAHLGETSASVAATRARLADVGVDVHWVCVVDGPGDLAAAPEADLVLRGSRPAGVSACRNLALSRTRPGWVFRLDGDDVADPDGWHALVTDPRFGSHDWYATNMVTTDGQRTAHWFDTVTCWPAGQLEECWRSPFLFHPNNIVVRTEAALAAGGWPALRVNEDLGYCLNVSHIGDGLTLPAVTMRYRKWEHQTVAGAGYLSDKQDAFSFIEATVNARRALERRPPIRAPRPGVGVLYATPPSRVPEP